MRNIVIFITVEDIWQYVKALMKSETTKPGIVQNKIEQRPFPEENVMF